MLEQDAVYTEWKQTLKSFPPLLTPRQVQEASLGIIKAGDIYKRHGKEGKRLALDFRMVGGRVFVTWESLAAALAGTPDLPL
ncbi:MAG: hypothetical protein C4523_10275 [Myxococcales bacterium]|nr:MAG: hypothetical protein C4523_10275 [Myxococcales bacterium]